MHELTPDPVEALRLSSALLALLPECKGATHSEAVSHCAECCFGSGYELHGPEDQAILDAATFLAALAALPAPEEPPPFGSVPFGTMFIPGPAFLHGDNEWIDVPGPITVPPKPLADPAPVGLTEAERLHMTNLREAWRIAAPVYTDLAATDVEWLCTIIDRLSAAPVDDRERVPEGWRVEWRWERNATMQEVVYGTFDPVNVPVLVPVSPSVDPEEE